MDAELQELERRARSAPGPESWRAASTACLRRGRVLRALTWARGLGRCIERDDAGRGLAAALAIEFDGVSTTEGPLGLGAIGFEYFSSALTGKLVLVPGGQYLEDGASAWASILKPGGSRAALRPQHLPDFLIGTGCLDAEGPFTAAAAQDLALARGGRLPTIEEWKKAMRGGLFLDGDLLESRLNPEPDRLGPRPSTTAFVSPPITTSPYGVCFNPTGGHEWAVGPGGQPMGVSAWPGARYYVPGADAVHAFVRLVLDLPRSLG